MQTVRSSLLPLPNVPRLGDRPHARERRRQSKGPGPASAQAESRSFRNGGPSSYCPSRLMSVKVVGPLPHHCALIHPPLPATRSSREETPLKDPQGAQIGPPVGSATVANWSGLRVVVSRSHQDSSRPGRETVYSMRRRRPEAGGLARRGSTTAAKSLRNSANSASVSHIAATR